MDFALIRFGPEHFDTLISWFPDERALVQWGGNAVAYPMDGAQLEAMRALGAGAQPVRRCWMIVQGADITGHVQLALDWRHGVATLSRVALAPTWRGCGLAAAMLRPAVQTAFAIPDIARLELRVFAWNIAAIKTYKTLGFTVEGISREATRVGPERWDAVMMSMLRREWQQGRSANA
jgi:RimJ/RimL family protein N-acetyltransferase